MLVMSAIFGPSLGGRAPAGLCTLSAEHIVPCSKAAAQPVQLAEQPTQRAAAVGSPVGPGRRLGSSDC